MSPALKLKTIVEVTAVPLKECEASQAGMPLLADLLFDRKTGRGYGGMRRTRFMAFRIYGANQVIDGCLFPYVPSSRTAPSRGGLGNR